MYVRVLVCNPEGKRTLGRIGSKREDNINIDRQDVRYKGMDRIELAQDRNSWRAVVKAVMNLLVPQNARNFLSN